MNTVKPISQAVPPAISGDIAVQSKSATAVRKVLEDSKKKVLSNTSKRWPKALILGNLAGLIGIASAFSLSGLAVPSLVFAFCSAAGIVGGLASIYLAVTYSRHETKIAWENGKMSRNMQQFWTLLALTSCQGILGIFAVFISTLQLLPQLAGLFGVHVNIGDLDKFVQFCDDNPCLTACLFFAPNTLTFIFICQKFWRNKNLGAELDREIAAYKAKPQQKIVHLLNPGNFNLIEEQKKEIQKDFSKPLSEEQIQEEHQYRLLSKLMSELGPDVAISAHKAMESAHKKSTTEEVDVANLKRELLVLKFKHICRVTYAIVYILVLLFGFLALEGEIKGLSSAATEYCLSVAEIMAFCFTICWPFERDEVLNVPFESPLQKEARFKEQEKLEAVQGEKEAGA